MPYCDKPDLKPLASALTSDRPKCGDCGRGMTPQNSQKYPELFLCDTCAILKVSNNAIVSMPRRDLLSLIQENRRMRAGLKAVEDLIADSHGVAGLHLNGDVAPWEELRTGGRFEEWLLEFDDASTLIVGEVLFTGK